MATYPNIMQTFAAHMFVTRNERAAGILGKTQQASQPIFGATSQLFTSPPPPNPYQPQRPRMAIMLDNQGLKKIGQKSQLDDGTYSSKMLDSGGLI